jgi:hypothetical protein
VTKDGSLVLAAEEAPTHGHPLGTPELFQDKATLLETLEELKGAGYVADAEIHHLDQRTVWRPWAPSRKPSVRTWSRLRAARNTNVVIAVLLHSEDTFRRISDNQILCEGDLLDVLTNLFYRTRSTEIKPG